MANRSRIYIAFTARLARLIETADARRMVVIVGCLKRAIMETFPDLARILPAMK